jgi:hypothetical protein
VYVFKEMLSAHDCTDNLSLITTKLYAGRLSDTVSAPSAPSIPIHKVGDICQTSIGSCLKYSIVQVIDTLVSVFSKEHILVLPVLRGVSDIDGTFL